MQSPHDVAAAKGDFLDALVERVGRFARGANPSKRYVRELDDWLTEHHGGDARVEELLEVLRAYPASVGRTEAMDACGEFLQAVRREVEGERFPWRDVDDEQQAAWRRAFDGGEVPAACPLCGASTLRRYLRAYDAQVGGGWEWCGSCFSYQHHRAAVPPSWPGDRLLDTVPTSVLEHSPEFLERAIRLARPRQRPS